MTMMFHLLSAFKKSQFWALSGSGFVNLTGTVLDISIKDMMVRIMSLRHTAYTQERIGQKKVYIKKIGVPMMKNIWSK